MHFTKEGSTGTSAYSSMLSILSSGEISARSPFGVARKLEPLDKTQQSACFSEIPLDRLDRLVERRSSYGIGFHQDYLVKAGGGRVWYIDNESHLARSVQELVALESGSPIDAPNPLWKLTSFIDLSGGRYRFEWEREWRVPGGLAFSTDQVAFLFIPEDLHSRARKFFDDAGRENTGPNYRCPFLDPLWPDDLMQFALDDL